MAHTKSGALSGSLDAPSGHDIVAEVSVDGLTTDGGSQIPMMARPSGPPAKGHKGRISIVREAKIAQSLRATSASGAVATAAFEKIKAEVEDQLEQQGNIRKNWWESMKQDNDLCSMMFGSWESSAAAKRGVALLAKVITLLFVCCLSAPDVYLCPELLDDDGEGPPEGSVPMAAGDDAAAAAANTFLVYPDFTAVQKEQGTAAMFEELGYFVWDNVMDLVYNLMWTLPVVLLMYIDFEMGELLDNMDRLNEERLTDSEHLAIARPEALTSVRDAMVAKRMIDTMIYVLHRMDKVFNSKGMSTSIQKELKLLQDEEEIASNYFQEEERAQVTSVIGGGGDTGPRAPWVEVSTEDGRKYYHNTDTDETSWEVPVSTVMVNVPLRGAARKDSLDAGSDVGEWSHYDAQYRESSSRLYSLSAIRANIKDKLRILQGIHKRMDTRLELFRREDEEIDAEDYKQLIASGRRGSTCVGRAALKREFRAMVKMQQKEIEDAVALAVLPRRLHVAAEQQQKIVAGFSGRIGSMPMGMFSGCIRGLKRYLYSSYCQLEVDMSRTTISRKRLVLQKRVSYTIGIVYLMACTFYIFLYAVRVQDNDVVSSVLMSVAFSDGLEVLVTGPLVMLLTAGVFPMLAVGLIGHDIRKILTQSKRKLQQDSGGDDEDHIDFSHGGGMLNPLFDASDYQKRGSKMADENSAQTWRAWTGDLLMDKEAEAEITQMERARSAKVKNLFGSASKEATVEVEVTRTVELTRMDTTGATVTEVKEFVETKQEVQVLQNRASLGDDVMLSLQERRRRRRLGL